MESVVETDLETTASESSLLKVRDVYAGYDEAMILKGVSIDVPDKGAIALLGRNGVGKTTLLNTILGIVPTSRGSLEFDGKPVHRLASDKRARLGIGYVPQGRDIFPGLTVWENLNVSLRVSEAGKDAEARLESAYELFPVLKDMLKRKGGVLSGGQQQQLAIARALLLKPKLLILDEPTEGIQPSIIDQIEDAIYAIRKKGEMSVILVEQYIDFARNACNSFYILERGSVVKSGDISLLDDEMVDKYLTV